ncbi:hypothetical protein ABFS82_03G012000 [Erythranthe guttata]|uniref:Laccase n=1 Tax=Erythranthe guttata TaxID=4155 RepID=A0A022RU64_ERYGU|nr:PREDICTED: laccase-15 [Erythranthe guttata]EYU43609.1 hypothetical protein MIMGU_mgv1a018195mg [Erythranthe guttata]|eukprot:XP_012829851.1 PREDICTED: laccase-15 [Erythranthe guttata]
MLFLKYMHILLVTIFANSLCLEANNFRRYRFVVKEASYKRLCETKTILTVNGKFPGPTLKVYNDETIIVDVFNKGKYNITIHWHGVKQPRNPWTDGPEYVTQCPIKPGNKFSQKVIFSKEEGTLWWHAHSDWSRATVHGAIIVYPKPGSDYPFPKPHAEVPIILGEWWKEDIMRVLEDFVASGGQPIDSDAYTINGQPGDLYPCSNNDTFKMKVKYGKTYLLRLVNADMNEILFFGIAKHNLTVVGVDATYTKQLTRDYIVISPGQTMDCLLHADQDQNQYYYMAAKPYVNGVGVNFDNTTTTAIVQYNGTQQIPSSIELPILPPFNDTASATNFSFSIRSLNTKLHPSSVPLNITKRIVSTISVNVFPCPPGQTCAGPNGTRLAASMNNISFVNPPIDILEAYFYQINGVFGKNFPIFPPLVFNYTADFIPLELEIPKRGTQVRVIKYNSEIEVVFQGTNAVAGIDHPMHLHGFNFYVVGWGFGNFDEENDPLNYNLIDPQIRNTIIVPKNGWVAIRFKADNPGVWFLHCHFERHLTWGMETVFIVRSGRGPTERVLPPPADMPPC